MNDTKFAAKEGLDAAYRHLLAPLVRILIRNGVSALEFSELVRSVYVEVASKEFQLAGRKQSNARISILTGLNRKEVQRLRGEASSPKVASNLSRVGRVLTGWNTDPDFMGPYGMPLELPFEPKPGGRVSFTELVRRHSGDMPARAMLDELIRVGCAEELEDGNVRLKNRAYIPIQNDPAAFERFGRVISRLADTVDYNMQKKKPGAGRFERAVYSPVAIPREKYAEFDALVRAKAQELLELLDNWLNLNDVGDKGIDKTKTDKEMVKTGVGIYHFVYNNNNGEG